VEECDDFDNIPNLDNCNNLSNSESPGEPNILSLFNVEGFLEPCLSLKDLIQSPSCTSISSLAPVSGLVLPSRYVYAPLEPSWLQERGSQMRGQVSLLLPLNESIQWYNRDGIVANKQFLGILGVVINWVEGQRWGRKALVSTGAKGMQPSLYTTHTK
jgi:hypothetical protein